MSGNTAALLSGSTIIIIYGVVLTIFFVVLVALTITLFKQKNVILGDDYEDEEEAQADDGEEADDDADYEEEEQSDTAFEIEDADAEAVGEAATDDGEAEIGVDAENEEDIEEIKEDMASESQVGEPAEEAKQDGEPGNEADSMDDGETDSEADSMDDGETDSGADGIDTEEGMANDAEGQAVDKVPESEAEEEIVDSAFAENSAFPTGSVFEDDGVALENPASNRVMYVEEEIPADSAFAPELPVDSSWLEAGDSAFEGGSITDEDLAASVKEAAALGAAVKAPKQSGKTKPEKKKTSKLKASGKPYEKSNEEFYWYNKVDVAEKPSYKPAEMYYHYFNIPEDCMDDLLMEMYDCALVRTEEIRYIAYGIAPRAVSMKEILSAEAENVGQKKLKNPSTQDMIKIYEKWCGYVDKLFDQIEVNADKFTIDKLKEMLYDYGKNDIDVLLEVK